MNALHRSVLSALCLAALVGTAACSSDGGRGPDDPDAQGAPDAASDERDPLANLLETLPAQAWSKIGTGEPRTAGYWIVWSTCGEGSRAATAAANGGREAGWLLVDDLLEDPGVTLGEWSVTTCGDAVRVLESDASDPASRLARQLLAAELNRGVRAATCAVVQEVVRSGHALLARQRYEGYPADPEVLNNEIAQSMDRAADLLQEYNAGRLCR